jgi:hypothetical protein
MYAYDRWKSDCTMYEDGYECKDCAKLKDKIEDIAEFSDLVIRQLIRGDRTDTLLGIIDDLYSKFEYVLPKEIIESFN